MKNFPKPIGFIYGYQPSGHQIASIGISEFLPKDLIKPYFLNLSEILPGAFGLVAKGYLEIIQKTPLLWDYLYDNWFLSKTYYELGLKVPSFLSNMVARKLIKYGINSIVSSHALSSIITSRENIKIKIRNNFAVITDIYAHSFWPREIDKYFVAHYQTYKTLCENGVSPEKIEVVGMPLRKEFYEDYNHLNLRKKLNIPDRPTFLITGGTKGIGDIVEIVEMFKEIRHKVNIIVFCGSNKNLKNRLKEYRSLPNLKLYILGYQKNPAIYYAVSDMVIGKSGGITIFETAAMKKMFVIYSPLPGQEERNAKFLTDHHCALNPETIRNLKNIIEGFIGHREYYEKYINNLHKLHKKDASLKIANRIVENVVEFL